MNHCCHCVSLYAFHAHLRKLLFYYFYRRTSVHSFHACSGLSYLQSQVLFTYVQTKHMSKYTYAILLFVWPTQLLMVNHILMSV